MLSERKKDPVKEIGIVLGLRTSALVLDLSRDLATNLERVKEPGNKLGGSLKELGNRLVEKVKERRNMLARETV